MAVTIKKNEYYREGQYHINVDFTDQNDSLVFAAPRAKNMSIQSEGTHLTATIDIQGSNDGVSFYALPTAVSLTAAGIKSVVLADLGFKFYRVIELVTNATLSVFISWNDK